jgi:hypothetical protein
LKKVLAHLYILASAYTVAYIMSTVIIIAAALTLHFIFWIPLTVPPLEVLGIGIRFVAVVAAILVVLYARSLDYRESVVEYLQR